MPYAVLEAKLKALPEAYIPEVYDFVDFLLTRKTEPVLPNRRAGVFRGKIRMAPDFDATPDCFAEYMP